MPKKKDAKKEQSFLCSVVIAAGGTSSRMGGPDKLFCELGGIPLLAHTLTACERSALVAEIVIATTSENIVPIGRICRDFEISKATKVILGGPTRLHSVYNGLMETNPAFPLVAIHDAARPLCTPEVIDEAIRRAATLHAVIVAVPTKDTIKTARDSVVTGTLCREELVSVQTPQVFDSGLIKGALATALQNGWDITDDATAVERMGLSVSLSPGRYDNIKVTTPEDLIMAEALLSAREAL